MQSLMRRQRTSRMRKHSNLHPKRHVLLSCTFCAFTLTACGGGGGSSGATTPTPPVTQPPTDPTDTIFTPHTSDIVDPSNWYPTAAPNTIDMHVRTETTKGVCETGDYSGCTLDDVNNDNDPLDDYQPEIKVHFRATDFADDGQATNAELRTRGKSSQLSQQKSFRVKLDSKKTLWRDERRIQLNKHPWDLTRVRNKLAFDLLQTVPHLPSLRTQFVNLYISDNGAEAVDYGLFTHAEHIGKEYLVNRGWDKDSGVYKSERFAFRWRDIYTLNSDCQPVDIDAFETRVEIKRGDDHCAFVEMLKAVNDESNDFETVFEQYFNRNNYLAWFASNILLGNLDTQNQNFYIYNPKGTKRFYFLPWDYDGALGWNTQPDRVQNEKAPARWARSVGNWWNSPLHQRFLQTPNALETLNQAVLELSKKYLNQEQIQARVSTYFDIAYQAVNSSPDQDHLPSTKIQRAEILAEFEAEMAKLPSHISTHITSFQQYQHDPMPFWLSAPTRSDGLIKFYWGESIDLQKNEVYYELSVARTIDALDDNIIASQLNEREYTTSLESGEWYMRVTARDRSDPQSHWQIGYDNCTVADKPYYGVLKFSINGDTIERLACS